MEIIPAIIPQSYFELKGKLDLLDGTAPWVQIDINDGLFAQPATWSNAGDLAEIPGKVKFELHLMVERPEEEITTWLDIADRIIIHAEATDVLGTLIDAFAVRQTELGVALLLDTPVSLLEDYKDSIKTVQLMGIRTIGAQGVAFNPRVLEKIKEVKALNPAWRVQVDGGMNPETIKLVKAAGADAVVVGSYLWSQSDIPGTLEKLKMI
jgi:ribulose-phosphate 3-epimerase